MLAELSIKNLAIIDDLSVSFTDGLTVLSGETGAGKSIIINAVNLILGNRATSKLIRTGEENAEIEAMFTIQKDSPVSRMLKEHGCDDSDGLLIRRIISANDRHKMYINGRMCTVQMLSDITQNLASISGQHAHQGLLREEQHLLFLDQFGNLLPLKETVAAQYAMILPLISSLEKIKALEQNQAQHMEFLSFQKNDIEKAHLLPNEDEDLEKIRLRLKHGETLRQIVHNAMEELYRMDGALIERLSEIQKNMAKAAALDSGLNKTSEDVSDIIFKIEDIAGTLGDYEDQISTDTNLLDETEARLDFLNKIKRKYAGPGGSLDQVDALYQKICHELKDVENLSSTIRDMEQKLARNHGELVALSRELSLKRKKAAARLSSLVEGELASLDMKKTRFEVRVSPLVADSSTPTWLKDGETAMGETGQDKAMFMIAPNVGEEMKPLAKIASGGELSRVVLSLKAILAGVDSVETIIFDEVDAGIGGGVAEKVGEKIKALSAHHQVICITHLPQIAKFGDQHYKIEKTVSKGRTCTGIHGLSHEQRVYEMARMLGGSKITEATLAHAREMVPSNSR
ncbi:MAG: DNA repair protein RecN [Proteobacteria bacterium]|nr:DNA repair protein RecN [Pseudomonadota bacterium]